MSNLSRFFEIRDFREGNIIEPKKEASPVLEEDISQQNERDEVQQEQMPVEQSPEEGLPSPIASIDEEEEEETGEETGEEEEEEDDDEQMPVEQPPEEGLPAPIANIDEEGGEEEEGILPAPIATIDAEEEREEGEEEEDEEREDIPEIYVQFERRGFVDILTSNFDKYMSVSQEKEFDQDACKKRKGGNTDFEPFRHQELVRDFLKKETPYRGAVFYHGLGSGKTCSSVTVAEALKTDKDVIVMLPKSLRGNFTKQLMVCGDPYFRKGYKWLFNNTATPEEAVTETGFSLATTTSIIHQNGGFFYVDNENGLKVNEMTNENRAKLDFQIIQLLNEKYKFIHYNGLRESDLPKFHTEENFFNNKVIIIDEYHNFISMYVNQSKIIRDIYNLMIRAKNTKIIALSGTPIINSPEELSSIINLIAGFSKVYTVRMNTFGVNYEKVREILDTSKYIHYYDINPREHKIYLVPLEEDFENVYDGKELLGVRRSGKDPITDKNKIDDALQKMRAEGISFSNVSVKPKLEKRLPDDFDGFVNYFVDSQNNEIKNPNLFMRRILGTVSYYAGNVTELLPQRSELEIVRLPFSDYQLQKYDKVRDDERKLESKRKGGRKKKDANIQGAKQLFKIQPNTFKVFSRQSCNFVFPEGIDRPYPKDFNGGDEGGIGYEEAKTETLRVLKQREELLHREGLEKYSPKYAAILDRINESEGPALVYSQFISMEGLDALGIIMEANGYQELRLEKTDTGVRIMKGDDYDPEKPKFVKYTGREDNELREIILDIYNDSLSSVPEEIQREFEGKSNIHGDIIKVLMISSSGAEGLDLKNIRQIHIVEPYWNNVRIQQVIGRGIRVCSHMDLPLEQRYVELFMYIMYATDDQLKSYQTYAIKDKRKSTDETILEIASRKEFLVEQILELIKRASFDCNLNAVDNNMRNCFRHPRKQDGEMDIMIKPFLQDELKDQDIKKVVRQEEGDGEGRVRNVKRKKLGNGKVILLLNDDNNVYDGEKYDKEGRLVPIGRLVEEAGKIRVKLN